MRKVISIVVLLLSPGLSSAQFYGTPIFNAPNGQRYPVVVLASELAAMRTGSVQDPATKLLTLPAEVKADDSPFGVLVTATTECKAVEWHAISKGLYLAPLDMRTNPKAIRVIAKKPGRYRLLAYTAKGDTPSSPAECVVVFPGKPDDNSDDDNGGDEDPIKPANEWQKAFNAEPAKTGDRTKTEDRIDLEEMCRQFAGMTKTESWKTWGQFQKLIDTTIKNSMGERMQGVRKLMRAEYAATFGPHKTDDPMTDDGLKKIAECFAKIEAKLKAVK